MYKYVLNSNYKVLINIILYYTVTLFAQRKCFDIQ